MSLVAFGANPSFCWYLLHGVGSPQCVGLSFWLRKKMFLKYSLSCGMELAAIFMSTNLILKFEVSGPFGKPARHLSLVKTVNCVDLTENMLGTLHAKEGEVTSPPYQEALPL